MFEHISIGVKDIAKEGTSYETAKHRCHVYRRIQGRR